MKSINKHFKNYSKAVIISRELVRLAKTDINQFKIYGYTEEKLSEISDLTNQLSSTMQDSIMIMNTGAHREQKQSAKEQAIKQAEIVKTLIQINKDNNNLDSSVLKLRFPNNSGDPIVLTNLLTLEQVVESNKANLVPAVISENAYTGFLTAKNIFANMVQTHNGLKITRTQVKLDRYQLLERIWNEVSNISKIGKNIWKHTDATMVNRYRIAYYFYSSTSAEDDTGQLPDTTPLNIELNRNAA